MQQTCIIIGASHAAIALCTNLKRQGWMGRIIVIGDEPDAPYQKPPLSKGFLLGAVNEGEFKLGAITSTQDVDIELKLACRVVSIDRQAHLVQLEDGSSLHYDKLAFCTGGRARTLNIKGANLAGIHYLRTLSDVKKIQQSLADAQSVVIVGGGYIGLETAAALRQYGVDVTVLEASKRVLSRVAAPLISSFYTRLHQERGVKILCNTVAVRFKGREHVTHVVCSDGLELTADMVIIGAGIVPNVELAQDAELHVDNGIMVDKHCVSSDEDIVAIGDCSNFPNQTYQCRMRLESVPNCNEQAKVAAAYLCNKSIVYDALPWFWSDQYDVKLQIAGVSNGYDEAVLRGDIASDQGFALFYLKGNRIISVDCINRPQEFMLAKRLITSNAQVEISVLCDETMAPKDLLSLIL